MTSNQKLDISSLLRWIIYISLCGEKFVNLRDFHIYLSIPLNATANKNIEVIPPFLDLEISSPIQVIILPPSDHSLRTTFLHIYKYCGCTTNSLLPTHNQSGIPLHQRSRGLLKNIFLNDTWMGLSLYPLP